MQLLHELVLLCETIDKTIEPQTLKVNLFTCHIDEFFNRNPYLGYQFESKKEDLRSNGLLSKCEYII